MLHKKWTEETVRKVASNYKTTSAFCKGSPGAYKWAVRNNLIHHLFAPVKHWTEEEIRDEAGKYKTASDFQKGSAGAYDAANRLRIHGDLGFLRPKTAYKWSEEAVRKEARKYLTKKEFEIGARGASERARKIGIIDDLGFADSGPTDNDAIYIWRVVGEYFNGHPVYKIGVTSARLGTRRIVQVGRAAGFEVDLICCEPVQCKATDLEKKLLILGKSPGYKGFDGAREFRALSDSALYVAVTLVCGAI